MPGGESTSAQLANTRAELERVRAQRSADFAAYARAIGDTRQEYRDLLAEFRADDNARRHIAVLNAELEQLRTERDKSYAANALLLDEMEALPRPGWIVARDGGRYCERCEQEITRGQAYEEQPGTGGLLVHFRCRDLPEETPVPATADDGPITPDDEIEIKATTVGTRTFTVNRAEYEQALADDQVDDLFDVYVSDMDEQTTYTTPDGRIHAYPSGEVIGDESDGAF